MWLGEVHCFFSSSWILSSTFIYLTSLLSDLVINPYFELYGITSSRFTVAKLVVFQTKCTSDMGWGYTMHTWLSFLKTN
jgi:hypothetical protein